MSIVFDDTKWFAKRKGLGVDYVLVVNCGAGGLFRCSSREEALRVMEKAKNNGCGYGVSAEDIHKGGT